MRANDIFTTKKHCLGAMSVAVGVAMSVQAQQLHAQNASASGATGGLEEVVVTAQRRAQNITDVPISITAVSGAALETLGIRDTLSLEQAVPGLQMERVGAYLQPNLRGVSTTVVGPGFDANIAIYVDGVYQSSMAGNIFALPDIERVEVLKGPQGTLFGRNATGGAIQIITRNPSFEPTGKVKLSYGAYSEGEYTTSASGHLSGPLVDDLVAGSISVLWEDDEGYMHNDFLDKDLGVETLNLHGKLLFEPSENLNIVLGGNYADRDDFAAIGLEAIDGNTAGRAVDPNIELPGERYHTAQDFLSHIEASAWGSYLRLDLSTALGDFSSLTAYNFTENSKNNADSDGSPVVVAHYINPVEAETLSQEFNYSSVDYGPFSYIAGLYLMSDRQGWSPFTVVDTITYQAKNETDAWAVYAEATYQLSERLSFIAGLRYSEEDRTGYVSTAPVIGGKPDPYQELGDESWDKVTPRFSAIYNLSDNSNVYFTYSEGFKSGGIDTLNFNPVPIDQEELKSYELGFKSEGENYSLSAAIYHYDYTDQQVGTYQGLVLTTQNAASSEIEGLDFEGRWRPMSGAVELQAGFSYIPNADYDEWLEADALEPIRDPLTGEICYCGNAGIAIDDASGYRIIRTPKFTGNLGVNYTRELGAGTLFANLNAYYSKGYNAELLGRIEQDSYVLYGAEVSWTMDHWTLSGWGRNLGDENDIIGLNQLGTLGDTVNYTAPRHLGVSVEYAF